jgi:GGDEF domain-containing protein
VSNHSERELLQKAIECYLSTIVAFANCIADICPDIGVPFRNQWRRLPQRIGFDSSPESLEKSRRSFEASLESLRELSLAYFGQGLPALKQIGEIGTRTVDLVLERNAIYSVQMASLAESLEATADLDAPPELRDQLEHHAAGLRAGARRVETDCLPALGELQKLVETCRNLMTHAQESTVVDLETGVLNARGLGRELRHQLRQGPVCVVVVDLSAVDEAGHAVPIEDFKHLRSVLAERITEQFRALDTFGRLGDAQFAVLFAGTSAQARSRQQSIARGISGIYPGADTKLKVKADLRILEIDSPESADALIAPPLPEITHPVAVS